MTTESHARRHRALRTLALTGTLPALLLVPPAPATAHQGIRGDWSGEVSYAGDVWRMELQIDSARQGSVSMTGVSTDTASCGGGSLRNGVRKYEGYTRFKAGYPCEDWPSSNLWVRRRGAKLQVFDDVGSTAGHGRLSQIHTAGPDVEVP